MKPELTLQFVALVEQQSVTFTSYSIFETLGVLIGFLPENCTHVEIRGNEGDIWLMSECVRRKLSIM
jgi:hypothetical protein